MEKEFLYIGHYTDTNGNYILKIGTTNDLARRTTEHTRNYRRAKSVTLPPTEKFVIDWFLPLSKYNTVRYEDKNRIYLAEQNIGVFIRNDRFVCAKKPSSIKIKIHKEYEIRLS